MRKTNLILSFFLLFFLAACHSPAKQSAKIVKINIQDDPNTLDPGYARSTTDLILTKMFFEGLTRLASQAEPELALARSVEISADLKTYTFQLNQAFWTNGDPVKASDFVYAWKRALSPTFSSAYASQLYCIKNGQAFKEGKVGEEALGVRAIDDQTLLVELDYPIPFFLKLTSMPIFFPICEKVDRENPKWSLKMDKFVCNGPYFPESWAHSDCLVAKKNPTYWDAAHVKLSGIEMIMVSEETEMKLLEKGELHWAGSPLSELPIEVRQELKKKGELSVKPILGTHFIRTNTEKTPLNNQLVRKALALAIERRDIVDHVTQGEQEPATGLVPLAFHLHEKPYFHDGALNEAAAIFDQALNELGLTRNTFPLITFTYASTQRSHLVAQAVQEQWRKALGIEVALESVERKVYFDRLSRQDYEMALSSWIADFEDPISFLELFKYKSYGANNTKWEDPTYRELIDASFKCMEDKQRYQLLADCEKILIDAMPIIPLYHSSMLYIQDPHLKNVVFSGLGSVDFKWADLETEVK